MCDKQANNDWAQFSSAVSRFLRRSCNDDGRHHSLSNSVDLFRLTGENKDQRVPVKYGFNSIFK